MREDRVYFVRAMGSCSGSIRWAATVAASSAREALRQAFRECPFPPEGFSWTVFRRIGGERVTTLYADGECVTWCGETIEQHRD